MTQKKSEKAAQGASSHKQESSTPKVENVKPISDKAAELKKLQDHFKALSKNVKDRENLLNHVAKVDECLLHMNPSDEFSDESNEDAQISSIKIICKGDTYSGGYSITNDTLSRKVLVFLKELLDGKVLEVESKLL